MQRRNKERKIYMYYLIGCGGVGGYLVPILSKMFDKGLRIIDGDIVEQKNLLRQNFYPNDISNFKAERLGYRYETDWAAINITEKNINKIIPDESVVFVCVDNNATRKLLIEQASKKNLFLINGANEKDRGHAFVYHPAIESNILKRYDFDSKEVQQREEDLCNIQYGDINYFVAGMMMWLHRYWSSDIEYCFKAWRKNNILATGEKKQEIITNFKTINLLT